MTTSYDHATGLEQGKEEALPVCVCQYSSKDGRVAQRYCSSRGEHNPVQVKDMNSPVQCLPVGTIGIVRKVDQR